MKKLKYIFPIVLIFYGLLFSGCQGKVEEEKRAPEKETSEITLSAEAAQLSGLKTEPVVFKSLAIPVKATGKVELNPKRFAYITARVGGRIEEVSAFEGDRVKAGQKLLSLSSPDFLASQAEFIQIQERYKRASSGNDRQEQEIAGRMLNSAENKLKLIGTGDEELKNLKDNQSMNLLLSVRAPLNGSVIESNAVVGSYVEAGSNLFKIADLSALWVTANIYEKDLSRAEPNSHAEIRVAAFPEEVFNGTLTLISDLMEEETRTVRARVEVVNSSRKLRPGMYADVLIIPSNAEKILVCPEKAIRKIEGKDIVFIPAKNSSFEPREVKVARIFAGYAEILQGLAEGELVVTEGSFSLKSEILKKTLEGD
jgi:RND family efflux transporter MFP subunit